MSQSDWIVRQDRQQPDHLVAIDEMMELEAFVDKIIKEGHEILRQRLWALLIARIKLTASWLAGVDSAGP